MQMILHLARGCPPHSGHFVLGKLLRHHATAAASNNQRHYDVLVSPLPQQQGTVASTAVWLTSHASEDVAAAAQASLRAVTQALHGCSPSLVYLSMSASLHASSQAVRVLHAQLEQNRKEAGGHTPEVQLAGCSSVPWHPHALAYSNRGQDGKPAVGDVLHLVIGAAHLPHHEVHTFHSIKGSLPHIPHLQEALSTRPPQVLLMGCDEQQVSDLRSRFEGLFGADSVLTEITAAAALPARRVGVVVQDGIPGLQMVTMPVTLSSAASTGTPSSASDKQASDTSVRAAISSTTKRMSDSGAQQNMHPLVYLHNQVMTEGCVGFVLYPKEPLVNHTSPTSQPPAARLQPHAQPRAPLLASVPHTAPAPSPSSAASTGVDPASALLLARTLFGWPRFTALRLSDPLMPHLQPPYTAPPDATSGPEDTQRWATVPQTWCCDSAPIWQPIHAVPSQPMQCTRVPDTQPPPSHTESAWAGVTSTSTLHTQPTVLYPPTSPPAATQADAERGVGQGAPTPLQLLVQPPHSSLSPQASPHPTHFIPQLPVFLMSSTFEVGPGGTIQLRIFEPRYQWLIQQAVAQRACWGFTFGTGLGVLAALKRYYLSGDHFFCEVEIGPRFLYRPERAVALPGGFGLVAADAQVVQDSELGPDVPGHVTEALIEEAQEVVRLLRPLVRKVKDDKAAQARASTGAFSTFMHTTSTEAGHDEQYLDAEHMSRRTQGSGLPPGSEGLPPEVQGLLRHAMEHLPPGSTSVVEVQAMSLEEAEKLARDAQDAELPPEAANLPPLVRGLLKHSLEKHGGGLHSMWNESGPSLTQARPGFMSPDPVDDKAAGKKSGKAKKEGHKRKGRKSTPGSTAEDPEVLTQGSVEQRAQAAVGLSWALAHRVPEVNLNVEWLRTFSALARLRSIHKRLRDYPNVARLAAAAVQDTLDKQQSKDEHQAVVAKAGHPLTVLREDMLLQALFK